MSNAMVPASAKMNTLKDFLSGEQAMSKLKSVAKDFMKPDDLIRMALVAVHRNPQILQCSQASILAALMDAAELKIKPGGMMGRGYLIPRKNKNTQQLECCFDPGWRGLIDIMRRTGEIKRIEAHPIFSNDKVRVVYGLTPVFEHEPNMSEDRGEIVGAYALAEFKDGTFQVELLTAADLKKIRASSMSANGPWKGWDDEMSRKSAVRRLSKYMPYDPLVDRAADLAAKTEPGAIDTVEWDITVPTDAEMSEIVDGDGPAPPALPEPQHTSNTEALKAALNGGARVGAR